jgi:hypothetical protein
MTEQNVETTAEPIDENISTNKRIRQIAWIVIGVVVVFFLGFGGGYLMWGQDETAEFKQQKELTQLYEQVNPKDGYILPVSYGKLGPQLMDAGVIDYDSLLKVMSASGDAISNRQIEILKKGSAEQIVITTENAHFLLNFFWAVGLANKNSILTEGQMVQYSQGQIERFASTGGWTLAKKPVTEFYASMDMIPLTPEQQARVEEVAAAVYRPCCDNHTLFPDCNHGMAMLGLLELMASQNASVDEMFNAAKSVNAYWFPQQTLEMATYLKANQKIDFVDADARLVVSKDYSSASGASMVHQSLQSSGLLKETPSQRGSCAN